MSLKFAAFFFMGEMYSCPKMLPTSLSLYFHFPSDKSDGPPYYCVALTTDDVMRTCAARALSLSLSLLSSTGSGSWRGAWVRLV